MGRLDRQADPRARLQRGAVAVVRLAIDSLRPGGGGNDGVRQSLRSLCRVARSHGVHAEHLVQICKEAWRTNPVAREIPRERGASILASVISQCIDEFYRTDGADMARAVASSGGATPEASLSFMLGPLS